MNGYVLLNRGTHIVDLRQAVWESHAVDPETNVSYDDVAAAKDWKPISVGKRWDIQNSTKRQSGSGSSSTFPPK